MECEIETDEIEEFQIYDWGEIQEKGSTTRVGNFFVENGAVIDARVSGSAIDLTSTGKEFNKWTDVEKIAREFKTADDAKNVVETDKHPWPTLIDLNDRFGIFPKHGVTSTGLFLVGDDGKILVSSYSIDDIKKELEKRL